jgi:hypothetical protein
MRRWVLPAVLAFPFAVAIAVDVVRMVVADRAAGLDLLAVSELRFEPAEPVFDLRRIDGGKAAAWSEPGFVLASGWGEVGAAGAWTAGSVAELELEVAGQDHRALLVEARADRSHGGPLALSVRVNGAECGRETLPRRFEALRFALPDGALRAGFNTVEMGLFDRAGRGPLEGRTALVRRVVVAGADATSFEELVTGRSLAIDRGRGTVLIRRAGRLVVPFTTTASGSVVGLRAVFREPGPQALCRVVFVRRFEGPDRFDVISRRTLTATRRPAARVRQDLRDRGEPCAVLIEVNRDAAAGGVAVSELLVETRPRSR